VRPSVYQRFQARNSRAKEQGTVSRSQSCHGTTCRAARLLPSRVIGGGCPACARHHEATNL
jgi:hypothetical protein